MYGLMAHYDADGVVVICTGGFTREAKKFAEGKAIDLIGAEELTDLMKWSQQKQ